MNEEFDYDTGYFEALRNIMILFMRTTTQEQFVEQLNKELKDAKDILNQYIIQEDGKNE